jgi:hypothetical protein
MTMTSEEFSGLSREEKIKTLMQLRFKQMPREQKVEVLNNLEEQNRPGAVETAARSFAQGLTFNFADEIEGVLRGGVAAIQGEDFGEAREKSTEESRQRLAQGRTDFPGVATAAEVGGGLASLAIPGTAVARGAQAAKAAKGLGKIATEAGKTVVRAGAGGLAAGVGEHGIDKEALKTASIAGGAQIPAIIAGKAANALGKSVVGTLTKVAVASGSGLVGALGTAAGTKLGKGLISKGATILEKRGKKSAGFVKMVRAMQQGSEKLGKNADKLFNAALESGAPGLTAAHIQLVQQDEDYRKIYE